MQCCEKWSEYYILKGYEGKVKSKGHLTKLQVLHYVQNANKSDSTKVILPNIKVSMYYPFFLKETRISYLQVNYKGNLAPLLEIVESKWKSTG